MDNFETYLYIIFAVIYIVSRIIKARGKQNQKRPIPPNQRQTSAPQRQAKPKKTFSFEDILKEFEKNLSGEEESDTAYEKQMPVQEIRHEKPQAKPAPAAPETPNKYQSYYDENMKSSAQDDTFGEGRIFSRNDNYKLEEEEVHPMVALMRDPDGAKNAIVLSEIINRKYV